MTEFSLLAWKSTCLSHVGKVRVINEDACLNLSELGLWAVADGMGGHEAGDVASRAIIEELQQINEPTNLNNFIYTIKQHLAAVNLHLRQLAKQRYHNRTIGSTIAVLLAFGERCAYIWVGDSRIYRWRDGALMQLTHDHNLIEEYIEQGRLTPEEAASAPDANVLTRAVGATDELDVAVITDTIQHGDIFLLCSDGLYKEVQNTEIANILALDNTATMATKLVDLCLARGARDNVTVAIVQLSNALP